MKEILGGRGGWAIAVVPLVVFAVLVGTGNLTTGPRLVDDNQIYKLQIELEESGYLHTAAYDITTRLGMQRLVPVYCLHKVTQAAVFGGNLVLWSIWTGLLASFAGVLLFVFGRLCRFSVFEALAFSLITIVGEQSVTWWRLLHGEGIGMALLSGSLVCMALRARTGRRAFEVAFVVLLVGAVLCKESFILAAPAILLWKVWLTRALTGASVVSSVRQNLVAIVAVGAVSLAALAVILLGFSTTEWGYSGWAGWRLDWFLRILGQFLRIGDAWVLVALLALLLLARWRLRQSGAPARSVGPEEPAGSGILVTLIFLSLTLPQLLLYMQSGMLGGQEFARYALPAVLGVALLAALLLRRIRWELGAGSVVHRVSMVLVLAVLLFDGHRAWRDGRAYGDASRRHDTWMDTLRACVDPERPIVLAYLNLGPPMITVALRAYYILRERHGFEDVYFLPLPPVPTIEEGARDPFLREDSRRHSAKMRHAGRIGRKQRIGAVLVLHHGDAEATGSLEEFLGFVSWFSADDFERQQHPDGHITFFRKKGARGRPSTE
jgi:hypothetical protein